MASCVAVAASCGLSGILLGLTACSGQASRGGAAPDGIYADATESAGLRFDFDRARDGAYFMPDSMAAGAAFLDYDQDGDLDVYIVSGFREASGETRTAAGANRLYRQDPGGRFTDVSAASGAADRGYGMGVAVGDVDNDGFPDLYVTNYGPDALYRNRGDGTFEDVTAPAGLGDPRWGASAGFFDYDADGDLDLFVTNYLDYRPGLPASDAAGRPEYPGPECCAGVSDALYRNEGNGSFTDVSEATGIAAAAGKGLGLAFVDLDRDGRVDVYVANDGQANRAWIQRADGSFVDRAAELGIALNLHGAAEASMGVAVGDVDGDLDLDLLLTHLSQETNTLYLARDESGFVDGTPGSGLGAASVDFTGFGTALVDFDADGDLDLFVANGRVRRAAEPPGAGPRHWEPYAQPNVLFENDGRGRFAPAGARCGAACATPVVGRGLAVGDVDGDGDPDLLLTEGSGRAHLYRNDLRERGHWLLLRVLDPGVRRDAYGATVLVVAGGRSLRRQVAPATSYLSSDDPRVYVGLGEATRVDEIRVRWVDGSEERFSAPEVDRLQVLARGAGVAADPR